MNPSGRAKEGGNVGEIKAATEALMAQLQTLGAQMYQEAEGAPDGQPAPETDDEDVIDAEFTET